MTRLSLIAKLTLPTLFFGYAIAANVALFTQDGIALEATDIAKGAVTAEIDSTYRANLLHKDPSVGWIGALRFAVLSEGRKGVVVGADDWLFTSEEFRFADTAPRSIQDTVAGMAKMQAQLAAMGTTLVILPLPSKLEIEAGFAGQTPAVQRSAAEYDQFLTALTAQSIAHFDSRAVFANQPAGAAFFQTDTHWTPATAEGLAQAFAASDLSTQGDAEFTRVPGAPVHFHGDLVTFITSDTLAPFVGLSAETATPWVAEPAASGALDLFGNDDAVDVVLIGTSYSANPNWSFGEALKVALKQDVLNMAAEGQGPVAPMLDYIATGAGTLDTLPKLVIWEFPVRYLADPALWPEKAAQDA